MFYAEPRCAPGTQPDANLSSCVPCHSLGAGLHSPGDHSACRRCAAGRAPDAARVRCVACGAGRHSVHGERCDVCPRHMEPVALNASASCRACNLSHWSHGPCRPTLRTAPQQPDSSPTPRTRTRLNTYAHTFLHAPTRAHTPSSKEKLIMSPSAHEE